MSEHIDIAIVGAGAAGLAAGIFAAEAARQDKGLHLVLLDGAKSIGAKILISGGGRCNVTHEKVAPGDFTPSTPAVRNILAAFTVQAAREWFASMGVALKREETGKLFPITDKARTVLNALTARCRAPAATAAAGRLSAAWATVLRIAIPRSCRWCWREPCSMPNCRACRRRPS